MHGKLSLADQKLMHSVLQNDKSLIEKGKLARDSFNQGVTSFTPDLMFENLVENYAMAEQLYGKTLIRYVSGYDAGYVEKNIKVPEFRKILKKNIEDNVFSLKKDGFITDDYELTDKALTLASIINYLEELENIVPKGISGNKVHKKEYIYGDKEDTKDFKKGLRYRDIALKQSIKRAVRRMHSSLELSDLKAFDRQSKGSVNIIYGLDSSGSMKGEKIATAKKAGIALAFRAILEKDNVGLIIFSKDVRKAIEPSQDFPSLLREITMVRAASETNFPAMIKRSIEMFPSNDSTRHLLLLTDALPTVGKDPEKEALDNVAVAASLGITISLVGIGLDKRGEQFARKIAELGNGRFYRVRNLEELDKIVLEDYYSII